MCEGNVYYDYVNTKTFDYTEIVENLESKEKLLRHWNWRLRDEKVKYLNKHPKKVHVIAEYDGRYMVIRKKKDIARLIEGE